MRTDARRFFDSLTTDGVERSEPNGPPTAFRIWKQGSNVTDHGPTVFSDRSAAMLLAEQARRGNRFSIDVDHMSLDKTAPLENHAAVGWFSLDVRNGELWATNIEWVNAAIRSGLTQGSWKYMSPAYDVDDDGEVTSFLNLSLTANPATHATTALASRGATKEIRAMAKEAGMTWGAIKAALDGDDEDQKASAYAAIKAAFPDKEPDGDEEKKKEDAAEEEPKKDSADAADKKDSEEEPEKKDSTVAAALAEVNRLSAKVRELEKKSESDERKALLASRPDFAPELVKLLAKAPLSMVREHVAQLPKTAPIARSTESVQATRPGDASSASRLAPEESNALAERMGVRKAEAKISWDPNMKTTRVFPVLAGAAKKENV